MIKKCFLKDLLTFLTDLKHDINVNLIKFQNKNNNKKLLISKLNYLVNKLTMKIFFNV